VVTPLQLCTMAARVASGNEVNPRIVRVVGKEVEPRPALKRLAFADDALAAVRSGMNAVTNIPAARPSGSAFPIRASRWRGRPGRRRSARSAARNI